MQACRLLLPSVHGAKAPQTELQEMSSFFSDQQRPSAGGGVEMLGLSQANEYSCTQKLK
jgi:hypothetical protein